MRWTYVTALSLWGLGMGLVTSLTVLPRGLEPLLWAIGIVLWIAVIQWRRLLPFQTGWATTLVSGCFFGAVQALLQGPLRIQDPVFAERLPSSFVGAAMALLSQGVVTGFLLGILVGGLCWGLSRLRR